MNEATDFSGFSSNLGGTSEEESFIDLGDLTGVPEQHALPAGEARLRGVSLEKRKQKPEKGNGEFLMAIFEPVDDPNGKLINHVMMLPKDDDDERTTNQKLRRIRDFRQAFGLGIIGPLNFVDFEGALGWAILTVEEDDQYGEQNRIKKFVAGA